MKKYVILTGAGISAESGLKTFRGSDGLWEHERIEDVCSPKALKRDPTRVKNFYNFLRKNLPQYKPNAAHLALAKLEDFLGDNFLLITQNVDDLHERAGSKRVLHMHGRLKTLRCTQNEAHTFHFEHDETNETHCPFCGAPTRPDIVFFEEIPLYMELIENALKNCDEFIYIGTSSVVYPAAGFKAIAKMNGARVTCINLEEPTSDMYTDEILVGNATEKVPEWVKNIINY